MLKLRDCVYVVDVSRFFLRDFFCSKGIEVVFNDTFEICCISTISFVRSAVYFLSEEGVFS